MMLCTATKTNPANPKFAFKCRKRADHILSKSKDTRQHLDPKSTNRVAARWDPTEKEVSDMKNERIDAVWP
jgi:hypothetical protein